MVSSSSLENEGCMVATAAQCHPSQGFCCGTNCQFANLIEHGIVSKVLTYQVNTGISAHLVNLAELINKVRVHSISGQLKQLLTSLFNPSTGSYRTAES